MWAVSARKRRTRGNGDKRLAIALTAGETLLRPKVNGATMHVFCAYDASLGCVHTAGGRCYRGVVQRVRKLRRASATATCTKGAILQCRVNKQVNWKRYVENEIFPQRAGAYTWCPLFVFYPVWKMG